MKLIPVILTAAIALAGCGPSEKDLMQSIGAACAKPYLRGFDPVKTRVVVPDGGFVKTNGGWKISVVIDLEGVSSLITCHADKDGNLVSN